ncbi:MAG TPA: CpsB/CapC family capsule biosynthesis tyrosine phosphatase [Acidobacteriaceae bacterium]
MIDIHHHLLWGLDDGSDSLETTLSMARWASDQGITHIVATSHASTHWTFQPDAVAAKAEELRTLLTAESIQLTIGTGCDFHLSYDNLTDIRITPRKYTINGGDYLLIELPDYALPINLPETLYELQILGLTPILTHPERNPTLQADPNRMIEWLRGGLLVQITSGSLAGRFGKTAEKLAHRLLADDWVHFVATDAHNVTSRPPNLRESYDLVARKYSKPTAQRLFIDNPLAAFESRPLGEQPEARHVFDAYEDNRSWLQKMFRR